jgi:hypothetical protein
MSVPTARGRCAYAPRIPFLRSSFAAAMLAALTPIAAQQVPEGLAATTARVTTTTGLALHTAAGLVTFDSGSVLLTPPGQASQTLLTLGGTVFGSFLLQNDANHVLFGHTGFGPTGANDRVWLLPLQGPPPAQPLAAVPFNYDAVMLTATTVLVSARTGGFAVAQNDLVVVDLASGGTQTVATLPGASGPVVIAPNGDVLYATASPSFPAPPGAVQILRFPRAAFDAAIANQTVLGVADAQVVWSGLDAASDFAIDDDGDLLFVDWMNVRLSEISDVDTMPMLVPVVVDYATAPTFPATLQFVPGAQQGQFEPFQPNNGSLIVFESDYWSTTQLRTIAAAPASLAVSGGAVIPAGPFTIAATNGPSLGLGVIAFAFGHGPAPVAASVPGYEQLLWLAPAVLNGNPVQVLVPFDAAGSASLVVPNPGFASAITATTQVVFLSTTAMLGATNPVAITIGQ